MVIFTNTFRDALGAALIADLLDATAELRLFTADPGLTKDTVLADLIAPTFTGYTDQTLAFAMTTDIDGNRVLTAGPVTDIATDAVNLPQQIVGAGIVDSAGSLVCAGLFSIPVPILYSGQQIHVTVRVPVADDASVIFEGYSA